MFRFSLVVLSLLTLMLCSPLRCSAETETWESYTKKVVDKVTANWMIPTVRTSNKPDAKNLCVAWKIKPDGTISSLRLTGSSKIVFFDQSLLRAVQNAAPFEPLPKHLTDEATSFLVKSASDFTKEPKKLSIERNEKKSNSKSK